MIELSKDEVLVILLDQKFYTYYEISGLKSESEYLKVTRKVLNREELKITLYYEQRKPTWFTKLLRFTAWDVVSVDMPIVDTGKSITIDPNSEHLIGSPSIRRFRLKTLQDILRLVS